jgi:hypothetical protein
MKKALSFLLAFIMLASLTLSLASCAGAPHKKTSSYPVDYMATYLFTNAYGESFLYTVGGNNRDYEDDYFFYSDGNIELIEKIAHPSGLVTYWSRDISVDKNAPFTQLKEGEKSPLNGLNGLKFSNLISYTGVDDPTNTKSVNWKNAGEISEIEFTDELESLENGLIAGREATFYNYQSSWHKNGPAIVALDNEYAIVLYFAFITPPAIKDKESAVEKKRYEPYHGPYSTVLCTSCLFNDDAPIIQDMLP